MAKKFEGQRIKGDEQDPVYLVLNGKLRHIATPDIYKALFGDGEWKFSTVQQALVDNFPKGPVLDFPTPLAKGFDDPVYLIDQGKKRWIKSEDAFNRYGFAWNKITNIGAITSIIPDGEEIE
ncbi:hypothetical protein COCVIDRAFT_26679 [Bipolaris victoriae FI3]|uniref:Uncharacterized protein n=2 Tax=Bipolaris TaxID=33194 RepID=W6Y0X5_COCC2|nr:uncharacterized protein COCCADRAFT_5115 [Bipolaris zeicola 26-R-13]XP_014556627.1 hypothetical protein COCVIDRAFT_26679 [Bipolaris victoriae FI3]EUC33382.1 hypothetical protein COCCADRAFT_5115 [Bipolaris zeicola 26-R-13]